MRQDPTLAGKHVEDKQVGTHVDGGATAAACGANSDSGILTSLHCGGKELSGRDNLA